MRIRILQPTELARLELQPGDEIVLSRRQPATDALLHSRRLDGERLAEIVDGEEDGEITTVEAVGETATKPRGNRGSQRSAPIG